MFARIVACLLFAFTLSACAAVPLPISHELATTSRVQPGAVTVVFFTDFQCPHCRRTHAALAPIMAAKRDGVRLVLRHVPLPRHPDARTAARAAVCFESIVAARATSSGGQQPIERTSVLFDEYVHALMTSPDLSEAACEGLAEEHGVARDALQRCLSNPSTDARIEQDLVLFDQVHGDGVPLIYVGKTRLEGAQSRSALESAIYASDNR